MEINEGFLETNSTLIGRKVDLLLRTGQILVESAADTNRIVRNMKRVAAYLGIPEEMLHIDVSYTMLQVNVSDDRFHIPNSRNVRSMVLICRPFRK